MFNFLYLLPDILITVGVPIVVVGGSAALVSRTKIGRALIDRVRSGRVDVARMEKMAAELEDVREELVEVHERLDATELFLQSKRRETDRLEEGGRDRP